MRREELLENRVHGDTMFPLKVYLVDYLDGDVIFHCHWHHELEFIWMAQGEALIQTGTQLLTLKAGEAVFIPSGQLHAAYPSNHAPFRLYAIVFDTSLLKSFSYDAVQSNYIEILQQPAPDLPSFIHGNSPWESNVLHALSSIVDQYECAEPAFELTIKATLLLLFADMFRNTPVSADKPALNAADLHKMNRLKLVLQHIDHYYHEPLKIAELAGLLDMSEGHFSRFFKSLVRMTPVEYINQVRINHAAQLLKETQRKIIDVSLEVGFETPSYFIKTFKRLRKCTPSQFRKAARSAGQGDHVCDHP